MTETPTADSRPRVARIHSIYVRCAGLIAVSTIVVATVLSFGALQQMDRMADGVINRMVARTVASGTDAVAKPLRFGVVDKTKEELGKLHEALGASAVGVLAMDQSGSVVASINADGETLDAAQELAAAALASGKKEVAAGGSRVANPVLATPEGPVVGVLVVEATYAVQRAEVWANAMVVVGLAAVTFVVMLGLATFLLLRMLGRPLSAMSEAVAAVEAGDYDSPSDLDDRKDEIGAIARNLELLKATLAEGRAAETLRADLQVQQAEVVEELGRALDLLVDGVLHTRIEREFPPEYERLRHNYNRAVTHLRDVMIEVLQGGDSILGNADQIAAASQDLAHRTETQAATLEQSAAAMEEMLAAVRSAARNAEEANQTMVRTREIAERNGEVMKSAVTAMGEIEKSSDKISEITSVIDDIAFQTNLLALNAGVEAARAGESGKGFAVVASEVRLLAQRSAEAAQQIKGLILGSSEQVKHGVHLVEAAGSALADVLVKVADVSRMVEHIAASATDQAQGLNEINDGISNLDRVTQQNAAMVEQSTAAAQLLHQEAESLNRLVATFQTGAGSDMGQGARAA